MPKRFTDTEIWKEDWFIALSKNHKLLWGFVKDNCDHAGIWRPNSTTFDRLVGAKVNLDEFLAAVNADKERIRVLEGGRWYLSGFVEFQYGGRLNPKNHMHQSVITILQGAGIDVLSYLSPQTDLNLTPSSGQVVPIQGAKDKDLDKDKDTVQDKSKEKKHPFKCEFVEISQEQYDRLLARKELGTIEAVKWCCLKLDGYLGQPKNRKKYTSHYHAILSWVIEAYQKHQADLGITSIPRQNETPGKERRLTGHEPGTLSFEQIIAKAAPEPAEPPASTPEPSAEPKVEAESHG